MDEGWKKGARTQGRNVGGRVGKSNGLREAKKCGENKVIKR